MSDGAGEKYKGYYIKTIARPINPHSALSILYEASASVSLDASAQFDHLGVDHLGEDQVFSTEFEAHRHAEHSARKYIDSLEKHR
jgi:hypothetical protein